MFEQLGKRRRRIVAIDTGVPQHMPPIVDGVLPDAAAIAAELARIQATFDASGGPTADELAARWDAAVREHASGDLEAAAQGYAAVLAAQPRFAPAHHLAGVVAAAREQFTEAGEAFAAAIAAEPRFVDARVAAADVAIAQFELDRALALVDEGLALDPRNVSLLRSRGRVLLHCADGSKVAVNILKKQSSIVVRAAGA